MNRASRRAFDEAAGILNIAFEQAGPFPEQEATPPLLADEIRKCLEICQQADASEDPLPAQEIDELGTHALECLSDLGLWAWQLGLDDARASIEDIALDLAQWIAQRDGSIGVLEPVVNAIARQANATQDPAVLARLFTGACKVMACVAPESTETDPTVRQPWVGLHFNAAIIATRTQQPDLMNTAYDLLETRLPGDCAAFYEEGLRESVKPAYDEPVRAMMRERLAKWTPRP